MQNICEEACALHSPSLAHINNHLLEQATAKPDLWYEASANLFTLWKERELTKRTIQMRTAIYISANLGMIIWEAS
jgi:hypothetical protein